MSVIEKKMYIVECDKCSIDESSEMCDDIYYKSIEDVKSKYAHSFYANVNDSKYCNVIKKEYECLCDKCLEEEESKLKLNKIKGNKNE
jgi:hypothetical protein